MDVRLAEDGTIPLRYNLTELSGAGYRARTRANVRDSDATLIVTMDEILTGGSKQTMTFAKSIDKPWIHVHPQIEWRAALQNWLAGHPIAILNVAGPRASTAPKILEFTVEVLDCLLLTVA